MPFSVNFESKEEVSKTIRWNRLKIDIQTKNWPYDMDIKKNQKFRSTVNINLEFKQMASWELKHSYQWVSCTQPPHGSRVIKSE